MAAQTTLTFQSSRPVDIDWGDGDISHAVASPAHHLYATAGPKTITVTDPVNGQSATGALTCPPLDWDAICAGYSSWDELVADYPTWDAINVNTWDEASATWASWDALAVANPTWDGVSNG